MFARGDVSAFSRKKRIEEPGMAEEGSLTLRMVAITAED